MNVNEPARLALEQARKALREKHSAAARQWAAEAVRLDPNLEEGWLILGALGTPSESVLYLQRALEVNPNSSRARAGLGWAEQRLREHGPDGDEVTEPVAINPVPVAAPASEEITGPVQVVSTEPEPQAVTQQIAAVPEDTDRIRAVGPAAKPRRKLPMLAWVAIILGLLVMLSAAVVIPLAGVVLARVNSAEHPVALQKPTSTQTALPTAAPTSAPTLTATLAAALATEPAATRTSRPTRTPAPTETEEPEPPTPTSQGGIPVVEITPIATLAQAPVQVYQPPDDYTAPGTYPTAVALPTAVVSEPQVPVTSGERWVDVNLSTQTAAAYEGDKLIRSFVVSTGTAEHPTVTGQYQIYVMYRYADMAGPGYYLPDVPYVMYFYSGYGLHGTYWHSNFGTPMSHGCVNFSIDDAAWLFDFVSIGTLVNVHY